MKCTCGTMSTDPSFHKRDCPVYLENRLEQMKQVISEMSLQGEVISKLSKESGNFGASWAKCREVLGDDFGQSCSDFKVKGKIDLLIDRLSDKMLGVLNPNEETLRKWKRQYGSIRTALMENCTDRAERIEIMTFGDIIEDLKDIVG